MVKIIVGIIILIVVGLIFFIKKFRWAGILSILLVAEIVAFSFYTKDTSGQPETTSEPILVGEITFEKGVNAKGEEGYYFEVPVVNEGSEKQTAVIMCYADTGEVVAKELVSVYQDINVISKWRNKLIGKTVVPPGTQTTFRFFVKQNVIDGVTGEQLLFQDNTYKIPSYISIDELYN